MSEKRRRMNELGESVPAGAPAADDDTVPSCARADAKPQNRDLQMKYDIAKNEDGPLKRTMKGTPVQAADVKGKQRAGVMDANSIKVEVTAERHPGLDDRLSNLEAHLAVRYGEYRFKYLYWLRSSH